METSTERTQKRGWIRLARWVGAGGKKALKLVMSVPGKVAKGGALANRAARLTAPYSLTEVWYVAVDDGGNTARITGTFELDDEDANRAWRIKAHADWVLEGTEPTLLAHRPDWPLRLDLTVKAGLPARYELRYSDLVIEPSEKLSDEGDVLGVFTPTEARLACDAHFSDGSSHGDACAAASATLTMTLPPEPPGGLVVAGLTTSFRVYGTKVRTRKADGVVIERLENVPGSAAPVNGVDTSIGVH